MEKKILKSLFVLLAAFTFLTACGSSDDSSNNETNNGVPKIAFDAVVGEAIELDNLIFPDLVAANDAAIESKWAEIDALYESLALIDIPDYPPEEVCSNIDTILASAGPDPILSSLCQDLAVRIEEISNLQEAVNYAANYLWASNNENVALVDGRGLALTTNEGVATIKVTDPTGVHTHDIVINAQKVVSKIRELQIQNEKFVVVEDGMIKSFNADASEKSAVPVTVTSYNTTTGDVLITGAGSYVVSAGQLITFAPSDVFPDGGLRHVEIVTDNGDGTFTLGTSEGSLAEVIMTLDLEHKEAVNAKDSTTTPSDTDLETAPRSVATVEEAPLSDEALASLGSVTVAEGVQQISADEFRAIILANNSDKNVSRAAATAEKSLLTRAAFSGDWSPDYAFTFNKTDSQVGEDDGFGSMGISGVIGFKMPIHMYLRYGDWKLQRFDTFFKPTQYSDIEITVDGDADIERTLAEVRGPSIKFFIGPLPVYVRPLFEITVGGSAVGNAVTVKVVDYEVWNKYGVSYTRGRSGPDWKPVASYDRSFRDPTIIDGDYSLSAWGQVKSKLRFYGLGGPYARAKIGARLTADTSKTAAEEDWARLRSYVLVSTGVSFDITVGVGFLDYTIVDYEKSFGRIMELYRTEWDSDGPYVLAP